MYFVYVDESGTKDPKVAGTNKYGKAIEKDWLYVLVGLPLYHQRWYGFESTINARKLELLGRIYRNEGLRLELADTEVHSVCVRNPDKRGKHKFLSRLTADELTGLVDLCYSQIAYHNMPLFAVVVDKRHLHKYFTEEMLHRKAYELLLERVDLFMRTEHERHRALMVLDDTSRQMNRSLAMKHSYFQREGTSSGCRIGHIVELPMFVASNLSNGVQLADLCAYNVYHAFRYNNMDYDYFLRMAPFLYKAPERVMGGIEGLKVFPDESPLVQVAREWAEERQKNNQET